MPPGSVTEAIAGTARPLGISGACIYLSDLQQVDLRAMPGSVGQFPETLAIDSTTAGRSYQTVTLHHVPDDGDQAFHHVWIPLIDGTERLGVLGLIAADVSEKMLDHYRMLASLAGLIIVSKGHYSDTYAQTRRSREMALQAEMVWAFMAPRTFATERVLITAILEPAYEVGGDAFDYSLIGDRLHVSIFDGVGEQRLADFVIRHSDAGTPAPETLRRLNRAIIDYQDGQLCDDTTTVMLEWMPDHPERRLAP
jgi:hypothetical protein